jgi:hypothetical protein
VEVDDHYEPPAAEAGACKAVQRDTQWKSARSDTERLLARFVLTLSGSAGFALSFTPFGACTFKTKFPKKRYHNVRA